jgi:hypothetical protein
VTSVAAAQVQSAVGTNFAGQETHPACVHSEGDVIARHSVGSGPVPVLAVLVPAEAEPDTDVVVVSPPDDASVSLQEAHATSMTATESRTEHRPTDERELSSEQR